jgi:hypothetical protein
MSEKSRGVSGSMSPDYSACQAVLDSVEVKELSVRKVKVELQ